MTSMVPPQQVMPRNMAELGVSYQQGNLPAMMPMSPMQPAPNMGGGEMGPQGGVYPTVMPTAVMTPEGFAMPTVMDMQTTMPGMPVQVSRMLPFTLSQLSVRPYLLLSLILSPSGLYQ
jgi:hypothetical protein